jgi:hypothetical protein
MSTRSSSVSRFELSVSNFKPVNNISAASTHSPRLNESKKFPYKAAVQVKFLHLQAEVESLLQQLQILKQQRLATASCDGMDNRH